VHQSKVVVPQDRKFGFYATSWLDPPPDPQKTWEKLWDSRLAI